MALVAIMCMLGGLYFLQFSLFPNGLNTDLGKRISTWEIALPQILTTPNDDKAQLTFTLSGVAGGEIAAGKPIKLEIVMTAPPTLGQKSEVIVLAVDNALKYPL